MEWSSDPTPKLWRRRGLNYLANSHLTIVSVVMVTLLLIIGLYAGKLENFIGPLSIVGKILSLIKKSLLFAV